MIRNDLTREEGELIFLTKNLVLTNILLYFLFVIRIFNV